MCAWEVLLILDAPHYIQGCSKPNPAESESNLSIFKWRGHKKKNSKMANIRLQDLLKNIHNSPKVTVPVRNEEVEP